MADIELRFHRDMLVLASSTSAALARRGVNIEADLEYINLIEPDTIQDILRLERVAGAHILVTNTAAITPARLAYYDMRERSEELACVTLQTVREMKPQHILFEIGPCNLPLDASSKPSLTEHRDQYIHVARCVKNETFDAYYLRGFASASELKCALMGLRAVDDRPIFAQFVVDEQGAINPRESLEDALMCAEEYGAQVAGFSTRAKIENACALAKRATACCALPLIVELDVVEHNPKQDWPSEQNPYFSPDVMLEAGAALRKAGVQFIRAAGKATPAYTGVLAATLDGLDVVRPDIELD